MWCYLYMLEKTGTANLKETFNLWQQRNPDSKRKLNPNTLATQRRYIQNNSKINEKDIEKIKKEIKNTINEETRNNENVINDVVETNKIYDIAEGSSLIQIRTNKPMINRKRVSLNIL